MTTNTRTTLITLGIMAAIALVVWYDSLRTGN